MIRSNVPNFPFIMCLTEGNEEMERLFEFSLQIYMIHDFYQMAIHEIIVNTIRANVF